MRNEDLLQHHGVKGMRWGVSRSKQALSKAGGAIKDKTTSTVNTVKKKTNEKVTAVKTRVKEEHQSFKRERDWAKDLENINSMSTNEVRAKTNRIRLENDMKALTKKSVPRTDSDFDTFVSDRKAYRTRSKLSDQELHKKVEHLRAKDLMRQEISRATKTQREKINELIDGATEGIDKYQMHAHLGKQAVDFKLGKYSN